MLITNQDEFYAFVERAKSSELLCIDTEFLREKTYHAKLCLLQLATDTEIVLVDPLEVKRLKRLGELLEDEDILKVFHAGTQDIEILYNLTGVMPRPVFDTQIAATLTGSQQQASYASLVSQLCGVTLKKADSYSDWSIRPLTASQLDYAADDVRYLPQMYRLLTKTLERDGRTDWLADDFESLVDPDKYDPKPRERYRRLKRSSHLSRQQVSAARELAAWREERAIACNIPRKWVLTDEQVVELCRREARTLDELFAVRGVKEKLAIREAREVAAVIAKGLDLPENEWPEQEKGAHNLPNVDMQIDLFMAVARMRAKQNNVALQTLAPHADLEKIARGERKDVDLLSGWRAKMLGDELVKIAEGKVALRLRKGNLSLVEVDQK